MHLNKLRLLVAVLLFSFLSPFVPTAMGQSAPETDYFKQANGYYQSGEYRKAIGLFRKAIKAGEQPVFAWFNLGHCFVQIEQYSLAVIAYRRSVELAPQFVRPWILLGDVYFMHQEYASAVVAYRRAIELGQENDHIHLALGEIALALSDYTQAEFHFEKALELNPNKNSVYYALAEIQQKLGDAGAATKVLEKAIRETAAPGGGLYFYLAGLYKQEGDIKKAFNAMEEGMLYEPDKVEYRRYLARTYVEEKMPWMAIFTLEEGLKRDSRNPFLNLDLGQIFFEQERYEEALAKFYRAFKSGELSGRIGVENVGNVWYNMGDKVRADSVYQLVRGY